MRAIAPFVALSLALAPVTVVASPKAPPPPAEEASYWEIQQKTRLDLSRLWTKYGKYRDEGETFLDYARTHIRHRRISGIVVLSVGFVLSTIGTTVIVVETLPSPTAEDGDALGLLFGAIFLPVGVAMMTIGGIQLYNNQHRLKRLRAAGYAAAPRLRLRAAGPIGLPRGAGLGLAFAF